MKSKLFTSSVSVFLCLTFILSIFPNFAVMASDDIFPEVEKLIISEEFDGDDIPSFITATTGTPSYSLNDGSLVIDAGSQSNTVTCISLGEEASGDWVIKMSLTKPNGMKDHARIYFKSGNDNAFVIYWSNSTVNILAEGDTIARKSSSEFNSQVNMDVVLYYDSVNKELDFYVNGKPFFDSVDVSQATKYTISKVNVTTNTANTICKLNSFEYYIPVAAKLNPDVVLQKDYDVLTESIVFKGPLTESGYLVDDLNLSEKGSFGSDILWSTSDADVVDIETGYIKRADTEKKVTLKASLTFSDVVKEKTFTFKVPARGASVDGYPAVLNVGYREDFNEQNGRMVLTPGAGKVEIKDGKAHIETSSGQTNTSSLKLYLNDARTEVNGKLAVEYTLDCSTSERIISYPNGNTTTRLTDIRWSSSKIYVYELIDGSLVRRDFDAGEYNASTKLKITLLVDTATGKCDILFNNKLAAENLSIKASGISHLLFFRDTQGVNATIDNFRVLYCEMEDERKLNEDAQSLSYESIFAPYEVADGIIANDIVLPTEGNYGSDINWISSHPDVIGSDGTVIRPDEDTEVTLTAVISSGSESIEKSFKITVLRNGDGDLFLLQQDYKTITFESIITEDIITDNHISKDLNLYTQCHNGSTITWESSNEDIISSSGRVTRPDSSADDIYVTLTAKVKNGDYVLTRIFEIGVFPEDYNLNNIPAPQIYKTEYVTDFKKHIPDIDGDGECNTDDNLGYIIDTWASCRGRNGSITEYDGYVEFKRNKNVNSNATALTYPLLPSTQHLGDVAITQFHAEKEGRGQATMQIGGQSGTGLLAIVWWNEDGSFTISCKDKNEKALTVTTKSFGNSADITFMMDSYNNRISMWVNNENVMLNQYPRAVGATGLRQIIFMLENTNYITFRVGNITTSYAYPLAHDVAKIDNSWLTEDIIRDGIPAPATGKLSANLNLITKGKYGADIKWISSNESVISSDGTVTRATGVNYETPVTLKAVVTSGKFRHEKEFSFSVMPIYEADENITAADNDYLNFENYNVFSFTDTSASQVTSSLNLPEYGPYGSTYLWKSSDERYLTKTGRVTRPRWDEEDKNITLTAFVVYGSSVKTKEFNITVLADEEIKDPKHMSDEEFFGVWNGTAWASEGKFDYSYKGLQKVEAAAKLGDYKLAKEELLAYMKGRPTSFLTGDLSRNPAYIDGFLLTGNQSASYPKYYQGSARIDSQEYKTYEVPVSASDVVKGAETAYKIGARYNENTSALILSKEHSASRSIKLVLTIDGSIYEYPAKADAVIRGGSENSYKNYGYDEEMEVSFFGDFNGDGTSSVLVSFDTKDVPGTSEITDAKLVITAKLDKAYADYKDLIIYQASIDWHEDEVTLNNFIDYTCNFNGIPGGNHWLNVKTAESEYHFQSSRQPFFKQAAAEYLYTGDEKYAYYIIWNSMDFIRDTQGTVKLADILPYVVATDWELLPDTERRGAFPRALDIATRATGSTIPVFETILKSKYMTADVCTTILKNLWDHGYELQRWIAAKPSNLGNQHFFETQAYALISMFMPEFAYSEKYLKDSLETYKYLIHSYYLSDGAYIESTTGYTNLVFNMIVAYWQYIANYGLDFDDETKEIISKLAIYNVVLDSPVGITIPLGDTGKVGKNISPKFPDYYNITKDEEYNFISTYGRKGTMPSWTSKFYGSTLLAFMRSGWDDDAIFALMSSSGFGGHGHADANAINVNAFGKYLLIDPGFYNYDGSSPIRQYAVSTRGHNTVEINNTSQKRKNVAQIEDAVPAGTANYWITNKKYDLYSVTTNSNVDADHRRTVTFVKPYFFIVSDLMLPYDETKENDYRQLWHMSADANLKHNDADRSIYSNFTEGANVIVASADTDAEIVEEMGYDTVSWGVAAEAKYGYYLKEDVVGKTTFDTVILPYEKDASAKAEHIDLGVPTHEATAMKVDLEISGEEKTVYYLLNYQHSESTVRTFGKYTTDAQMCIVIEDENGNITDAIIKNGSYIKRKESVILTSGENSAENVSYSVNGKNIELIASSDADISKVSLEVTGDVNNVLLNGSSVEFSKKDDVLSLTSKAKDPVVENDASSNKGGISAGKPSSGGNSGGGGASSVGGGAVVPPATHKFSDIQGHWAYDSIVAMANKNVVNGDGNGKFNPDNSITRAELITIAVRSAGLSVVKYKSSFTDVNSDDWYADFIQTALDNGIISAYDVFRPNDTITREEMCKIIVITNKLIKGTEANGDNKLIFTDNSNISDWATKYVSFATELGLMQGTPEGAFLPKDSATRAQAATVFYRILNS